MKALLIAAHGSRQQASNDEVISLAKRLAADPQCGFAMVMAAFIQFASPAFMDQVDAMARQGVSEIVVFPYFISAGSHVLADIPGFITQAREKYPRIHVTLLPHVGGLKGIDAFLLHEINDCLSNH